MQPTSLKYQIITVAKQQNMLCFYTINLNIACFFIILLVQNNLFYDLRWILSKCDDPKKMLAIYENDGVYILIHLMDKTILGIICEGSVKAALNFT